VVIGHEYILYL